MKEDIDHFMFLVKVVVISTIVAMGLMVAVRWIDGNDHRLGLYPLSNQQVEENI